MNLSVLVLFLWGEEHAGQICFLSNAEIFQDYTETLCFLENRATVKNRQVIKKKRLSKRRFPAVMHANNILHLTS